MKKWLKMVMRIEALLFILLAGTANAGIFGPSNYEECILEKIDQVKNEEAVRALQQACSAKFDFTETIGEKIQGLQRILLRKKCGLTEEGDYSANTAFITFLSNKSDGYKSKVQESIVKIVNGKHVTHYESYRFIPYFSFVNKNQFAISGLAVGFLKESYKSKSCSIDKSDYDAISYCAVPNYSAASGISQMQYGELPCDNTSEVFYKRSSCVVGYRPAIDYLKVGLAKFMDEHELCEW